MIATVNFLATPEDKRIIDALTREGEGPDDVIRRALRLLDRELRLEQARADMKQRVGKNLSEEEGAW
ncbi:hypothetical protein [Nonomuraea rhizosphaerae]|uniref:hypothetical protein n=1 Tax=Nonomuraea rhizosphaerae TaxID=2665663 RepID=UPI001C5EE541|nr:hypothetical protein [Nonomuraea rhizosphaerae]